MSGTQQIDRSLAGTSSIFAPHHNQERATETMTTLVNSQPHSTKRKRGNEDATNLPMVRLQTSGLNTPKPQRAHDALDYEQNLSPRTFVSSQLQSLNIHNRQIATTDSSTVRRTKRRTSWTVPIQIGEPAPSHINELLSREAIGANSPQEDSESAVEDLTQGSPSPSSIPNHDVEHALFHFSAGQHQARSSHQTTKMSGERQASPCPPARNSSLLPTSDQSSMPIASPTKRRRRLSSSRSPTRSPTQSSTQIPDETEPDLDAVTLHPSGKRRLSSPPPRRNRSDSSVTSESESENSNLWWQDSEITGHDPADPDDDNRGVNGIGYQKTKAEQYRISERKKRQITEYRNREARDARALRAAGRGSGSGSGIRSPPNKNAPDRSDKAHRVILGRVTKSRSGSPIERRIEDIETRSTPRKGVRFEEG